MSPYPTLDVTRHVDLVTGRFIVQIEVAVFRHHPLTIVRPLYLYSESVLSAVGQLVDLFQAHPEVGSGVSESSLVFRPRTVEVERNGHSLVKHDPTVDNCNNRWYGEGWNY